MASPSTPRVLSRWHSSVYVSEGQAAVELFFRLNHARQTMAYVRHQVAPRPLLPSHAALHRPPVPLCATGLLMSAWTGPAALHSQHLLPMLCSVIPLSSLLWCRVG